MAKKRELLADIFIDADNLFPDICGQTVTSDKCVAGVGSRKDSAIFPTGRQQRLSVLIQQARRNLIVIEGDLLRGIRHAVRTTAERLSCGGKLALDGRRKLANGGRVQLVNAEAGSREITAIGICQGDRLDESLLLNEFAPFHIVEKKCFGLARVIEFPESHWAADVEAV